LSTKSKKQTFAIRLAQLWDNISKN